MNLREGKEMHSLTKRLFPICRSLTGNGVRQTLRILKRRIPLKIREVKSGTKVLDWTIPREWNVRDAYIADESGTRVVDFKKNNLHVVGYSVPIEKKMPLAELDKHLHSLPEQPDAIPYVTSYYKEAWGFCLNHRERQKLKEQTYKVVIKARLAPGYLTYGELIIPGKRKEEVFISTYICHPSLANNELSGPVVTAALGEFLLRKRRRYTYRIVFIPETIGAITYLARHGKAMKKNVIAGFNLTCCGDERVYSFMPSRYGNTLADKVALRVLNSMHPKFIRYSFLDRESDERQYCSALVDLPLISIMRSKYRAYPEYHTSLDNLSLVTPRGLQGTYDVYKACIERLERAPRYRAIVAGEPQLGKRGLYKTEGKSKTSLGTKAMIDVLAYADGTNDLDDLSAILKIPQKKLTLVIERLLEHKLLERV